MALNIHWVADLEDVLEPAVRWLEARPAGAGLFDPDMVLVPTEGTRAWMASELAARNGARDGFRDGVVARVEFLHPGALRRLLVPTPARRDDPWSVDRLTITVLPFLVDNPEFEERCRRAGGPLLLARRLADRFDHYHTRRPAMIRLWEQGIASLSPSQKDPNAPGIPENDRWQFELWTRVRKAVGAPSPPQWVGQALDAVRAGERPSGLPARLLVAGLQSLSPSSVEILSALAQVCEIDAYLVHPSPALGQRWESEFSSQSFVPELLPERRPPEYLDPALDPLPAMWLQGSRELQQLLAAFGLPSSPHRTVPVSSGGNVLSRVQQAMRSGGVVDPAPRRAGDQSLLVHRCHSLSRQVEVLHDALLHAFRDIPDLQPHEVVVLSPRIREAAPLLEAVFGREVSVAGNRKIRLPLVVADRSLRRVSEGASFLADLLELLAGRCDVDALRALAVSPLVLRQVGVGLDAVAVWDRLLQRTRVGWGLDPEHRAAHGLMAPDVAAHSWWLSLERSLLGAMLPDTEPEAELGGVVPLGDIDPEELPAVSALVRIVSAVAKAEGATRDAAGPALRGVPEWCDWIEGTLADLCGEECDTIRPALEVLDRFRSACRNPLDPTAPPVSSPVVFEEFATLAVESLEGVPGRAPLRTGAITATSLVPLRGVPFRVVCLLGMDDGTFRGSEPGGDDLAGLQKLAGDRDPQVDSRRQFLDAVLSARDRLVVLCDGRSIFSNQPVPLATPLAEWIDFVDRAVPAPGKDSGGPAPIEINHPRHSVSPGNFVGDKVLAGQIWSHDTNAKALCREVGAQAVARERSADTLVCDIPRQVRLEDWERLVRNPIDVLVRDILHLNTFEEGPDPERGLIPLKLPTREQARLLESVFHESTQVGRDQRIEIARRIGELPVGARADDLAEQVGNMATRMRELCEQWDVDIAEPPGFPVHWEFDGGRILTGTIPGVQTHNDLLRGVGFRNDDKKRERVLGLHLLVLAALGTPAHHAMRVEPNSKKSHYGTARLLFLHPSIDPQASTERLELLDRLYRRACVRPYAFFGDTVQKIFENTDAPDLDAGREAFSEYLGDEHSKWHTEYRLFGPSADFDEVFDADALEFWSDFHRVMRIGSIAGLWQGAAPQTRRCLS